MRLVVFGPGYSAMAAIAALRPGTEWIAATARTWEAAKTITDFGIRALPFDGRGPSAEVAAALATATAVLVSIPPGDAGDPVLLDHASDIAAASGVTAIVYLSTVGVYGDHHGAWVDEATPPAPVSARSVTRLAAEEGWRNLGAGCGKALAILRLAGIYGPGRNALANLADGTARRLVKPGQVFNRIHVDDIATAIAAAFAAGGDGIFNVTDDEPAPPGDVVTFAAALMGIPPPPVQDFATAELTPMARSFYGENKRVRNARLKRELGVCLAYPTYKEGLSALWTAGTWRG